MPRSAGVERQGGALADVTVSVRSRSAELVRGPAGDSVGVARRGGRGGLRGRSRTRLGVQELLQKSRCQPSAEVGGAWVERRRGAPSQLAVIGVLQQTVLVA